MRFILFTILIAVFASLMTGCQSSENDSSEQHPTLASTLTSQPASPTGAQPLPDSTLDAIRERGQVRCGVNASLPGFGLQAEDGSFSGLDVDLCRALAAAVLSDPEAVNFIPLNAEERFAALQDGRVDVLIRNTTLTLTRDAELDLDFGPVVFYDGQGIMVTRASAIFALDDLDGQAICVQPGTTTAQTLVQTLGDLGISYTLVEVADSAQGMANLTEGTCAAFSADRTALIALQTNANAPDQFLILDVVLSQEPLAPAYREGDAAWGDVIRWVIYGLIHAERLGISSSTLESFQDSGLTEVALLLGESGGLGTKLGLSDDFMVRVIQSVGNYGEIYTRNLGEESPIGLPRGLNAVWTAGGLLYAPPFR